MIHENFNAILIGFGLAFMVGPVFFTLIETSITKGARAAIIFDVGVVLADITFISIAYFGSISFLKKIDNDPRLFLVGGLIFLAYGLYTVFYKRTKKTITDKELVVVENNNYLGLLIKGYFLNFINVGVLAFWMAIVIAASANFEGNNSRILKYFALVILSLMITDLFKIIAAKQLKKKLTPMIIRKIRQALGIFFIVFGLILVSKSYIPKETMDKIDNVIKRIN